MGVLFLCSTKASVRFLMRRREKRGRLLILYDGVIKDAQRAHVRAVKIQVIEAD